MGRSTQSPAASPATKAKAKAKAAPPAKKPKGVTKRTGRKQPVKKTTRGKGRGHKKTYPDAVTQAAHERQKELQELYYQVANAVKPGLEALADHSLQELAAKEDAFKEVEEYEKLQADLKQLYDHNVKTIEREFDTRIGVAERNFELEKDRINKCFTDSFNYATEEFTDGALNRTSILEELRNEGCPLTTPDLTYTYVEHIPYISFCEDSSLDQAHAREKARQEQFPAKRRAEDLPEEEPESKRPRHAGGLLASEQQPDGVSESNAPTPSANEEFEVAPVVSRDLPALPAGTSEPDEFGVRRVKKRQKNSMNRFVIPQPFQWDDDEIGFRDSTNDSTRRATRQTRGKFLDTPNSNAWFFDNTIRDYDLREYKDETLDPELVKKHRLHPKYGFFLPGSVSEPVPRSNTRVDGTRPIVHVPDQNTTEHASRSVRVMKMDRMLQEDRTKSRMTSMLSSFCENEDIDQEDIVTSEMRERETQARERLVVPDEDGAPLENSDDSDRVSDNLLRKQAALLLAAASEVDDQPSAPPDPPSPRHSRPYDAVRDVFTGTQPAPARSEQYSEGSSSPLNVLASAAEDVSRSANERRSKGNQSRVDRIEMEPRGYAGHSQQQPSSSNFLATALNPTSTYMPIAPAPPPPAEVPQQAPPHRNPFAKQNGIRDSPGLPPLRPNRSECLGKYHLSPQLQPLPPPLHQPQEFVPPHGLVRTNSGTYYAPAPTRAYHQAHSYHDPPMMQMPIPGQPMGMMPSQSALGHHAPTYHPNMSPMHGHAQLAPMPQIEPPAPSVSPPGPPMLAPSPPAHGTRLRTSAASNGNGASRQFRRIAAAPASNNRPWQTNGGTELRLAHYDHKEAIKDYRANEPPPRSGSINIRGWQQMKSVATKGRNKGARKEDSEEKDSPK
ncbi:hypothetical protein F5B19DRAFT_37201 [Rostrohypoxylon terebratum]|nr:hypothetical protein F5B19DRAFT_37201 [Rostrohypoxylon terebratum]